MSAVAEASPAAERELTLERRLDAPVAAVWRCWTEPALLTRWFTPAPWVTVSAEVDLRPGGRFASVMRSPEGEEFPNEGVFLEVVPGRRLVFTDAYAAGWIPSAKPFFTGIIELTDDGAGGTAYRAQGRHWTPEDKARHEEMGFHAGWNAAADQLEALAKTL